MTWLKLDDGFMDHPKMQGLSDRAFRLHLSGMLFSSRVLTDGHVPKPRVRMLMTGATPKVVRELVDRGLWHEVEDGYLIHDFLAYNPSREKVLSDRDWAVKRKELHSSPELVAAIRKRDGARCRYCGEHVNWKDRRGPLGATYDHVVPRGPNVLENIVVSCRGCNASKRSRTPEQAGMPLLPAPKARSGSRSDLAPDPTRPDPKGLGTESVLTSEHDGSPALEGGEPADTSLSEEQVRLNVESARNARAQLHAVRDPGEAA